MAYIINAKSGLKTEVNIKGKNLWEIFKTSLYIVIDLEDGNKMLTSIALNKPNKEYVNNVANEIANIQQSLVRYNITGDVLLFNKNEL